MAYPKNVKRLVIQLCKSRSAEQVSGFIRNNSSESGFDTLKAVADSFSIPFTEADMQGLDGRVLDPKTIRGWLGKSEDRGADLPRYNKSDAPADADADRHRLGLFDFGLRLRDCMDVLPPLNAAGLAPNDTSLNLWSKDDEARLGMGWRAGDYDIRGDELYPSFKRHLTDSPCWAGLQEIDERFREYKKQCGTVYAELVDKVEMRLPGLSSDDQEGMVNSLFVDACHRAGGSPGIIFSYEPQSDPAVNGNRRHLRLGNWVVGSTERPESLEDVAIAHKSLRETIEARDMFKGLIEAEGLVRRAIQDFQQVLKPDDRLRKLIRNGHCDLCP